MTDIEIVRKCAERMGYEDRSKEDDFIKGIFVFDGNRQFNYSPLTDDTQCMALVKHFGIDLLCEKQVGGDREWIAAHPISGAFTDKDANRAVCMCVAGME